MVTEGSKSEKKRKYHFFMPPIRFRFTSYLKLKVQAPNPHHNLLAIILD